MQWENETNEFLQLNVTQFLPLNGRSKTHYAICVWFALHDAASFLCPRFKFHATAFVDIIWTRADTFYAYDANINPNWTCFSCIDFNMLQKLIYLKKCGEKELCIFVIFFSNFVCANSWKWTKWSHIWDQWRSALAEEALCQEQKSQLLAISFDNTYFRDKKTHQKHYN